MLLPSCSAKRGVWARQGGPGARIGGPGMVGREQGRDMTASRRGQAGRIVRAPAGAAAGSRPRGVRLWSWHGSARRSLGALAMARLLTLWRPGPSRLRQLLLRLAPVLLLPALLAACASQPAYRAASDYARSSHYYPPPGPASDPWGPYIREAATRFGVPQQWVRAVMHQESGGHAFQDGHPIVSSAGAMGLMQVMPATYGVLRDQYDLGEDPYDPHNSILAGTAYIRQMYDRYGAPGFLAAYNAGPQRLDNYLAGNSSLPNETVNYLAAITPHLGSERPMSGPLAAYADASQPVADRPAALPGVGGRVRLAAAAPRRRRGGCVPDPDAAYDAPCGTPARPPQPEALPVQLAALPASAIPSAAGAPGCVRDPDAAYDSPCGSPSPVQRTAYARPAVPPGCVRDPDAAFDAPCGSAPAPQRLASAGPAPAWQTPVSRSSGDAASGGSLAARIASYAIPAAEAAPAPRLASGGASGGEWGVQVGAFASPVLARQTAESARQRAQAALGGARPVVGTTTPFGGAVLYRARLVGLSSQQAADGCSALQRQHLQCMTVAPGL